MKIENRQYDEEPHYNTLPNSEEPFPDDRVNFDEEDYQDMNSATQTNDNLIDRFSN